MTVNKESARMAGLTHGQLCYLQVPALDIQQSAQFYATVFGWHVEPNGSGFEAPGVIGQWIESRDAAPDSGPLAWINVDQIDDSLALATVNGGQVLEAPSLDDGVRWLATVRDPAGNTIGIVQLGRR